MFNFLLSEFRVNNSLKKHMRTRRENCTIAYIDVGVTEDHHLQISAVCILFAYCVSMGVQTREMDCFKNQLFQASDIVTIIKASRGKWSTNGAYSAPMDSVNASAKNVKLDLNKKARKKPWDMTVIVMDADDNISRRGHYKPQQSRKILQF